MLVSLEPVEDSRADVFMCDDCYWWDRDEVVSAVGICRMHNEQRIFNSRCPEFLTTLPCITCSKPVMMAVGNLIEGDEPLHSECDPPGEAGFE